MDTAIAFVGYSIFSLLMMGLVMTLIRSGARRTAPVIGTLIFTGTVVLFSTLILFIRGEFPPGIFSHSRRDSLLLLGAALSAGITCLFLFRALATGPVVRTVPLVNLSFVVSQIAGFFFSSVPFTLFRAIYLVLILLGTVLMVSTDQRYRDPAFLVFAGLSGLFCATSTNLLALTCETVTRWSGVFAVICGAFLFTLIFALLGRSYRSLRRMTLESTLFTLSAGVATGVSLLSGYYSDLFQYDLAKLSEEIASFFSTVDVIALLWLLLLPFSVLSARIFGRERSGGIYFFGLILALGGMFALTLNL